MYDWMASILSAVLIGGLATLVLRLLARPPRPFLLGGVIGIVATFLLAWSVARSRSWQLFDTMVARVDTQVPVVALTLDDGPGRHTDEVLRVLAEENVRATFFLTGHEINANPSAAAAIAAAGHEIGNHSWSHQRMVFKPAEFISSEIEQTDAVIRATGYEGPIHFRSPFGKRLVDLPLYLHRNRRVNIFFDVEPETHPAIAADSRRITAHTLEHTRPGSIILLHVMYPSRQESREALVPIIRGLRSRGFSFVTVSELIGMDRHNER